MPFYANVNGVIREIRSLYASPGIRIKTSHAGVDGVARDLERFTDRITRVVMEANEVETWAVDSSLSQTERLGADLATAAQYGSAAISGNTITVSCRSAGKSVQVRARAYIEYDDGARYPIATALSSRGDVTLGGAVSGTLYFGGDGGYFWSAFGGRKTGYEEDWTSFSVPVVDGTRSTVRAVSLYGALSEVTMTFGTILINGISYPVALENHLS